MTLTTMIVGVLGGLAAILFWVTFTWAADSLNTIAEQLKQINAILKKWEQK